MASLISKRCSVLGREFAKRALPEMHEMIRRRETHVVLSDEGDRYRRSWIPEVPQRVMILIHGYGEHAGRYDEMAMYFARRGFAVHAYDQVGHGRTSGPRGHVDRFNRLPEEVVRFAELVRLEHPGLSTTLVGHSMGGLVVAATAAQSRTGSLPSNQSRAGCTHSIATAAATSADIRPPEVRPATNRIGASTLSTTRALREACRTCHPRIAVAAAQPPATRHMTRIASCTSSTLSPSPSPGGVEMNSVTDSWDSIVPRAATRW